MTKPLIQINDVVREMSDAEYAEWVSEQPQRDSVQKEIVRQERNLKLTNSDWTQLPDSAADKTVWAAYRQALRDLPSQSGFPWEVTWPSTP
jgi:Phage tail assembly chaperone protein